jgi:hypothetical protein
LRWIIFGGFVLFIILLLISIFLPYLTERLKFFTVNLLSLLVLVIIAIQALISRRQWGVMQEQTAIAQKATTAAELSSKAAEQSIKLAQENAASTQIAMESQIQAMREQLEAMKVQANASRTFAEAAERSVEVTRQALAANVGIREIKMSGFVVGQIPTLYVTWYNGGQTPASRFRAVPYLVFGEKPEERGYFIDDDWSDSRGNFLPTGVPQLMPYPQAETGFKPVTQEMLAELESGSKRLYAMIRAAYVDFMGDGRSFEASYIYDSWQDIFTEL